MLRNRLNMGVLRDAAGAGDGTGGEGKTTAVDEKRVNEIVNGALSRWSKDELPKTLKTSFETVTAGFNDQFKLITENLTALATPPGTSTGKEKDGKGGDELSPAVKAKFGEFEKIIKAQGETITNSENLRVAAEKRAKDTQKESKIRASLGQFTFATPDAAEDAYILVNGKVDFNDDGDLLADGLLLEDFVKTYIPEKKNYLLASTGKGGSGASNGTAKGNKAKVDIEKIGPGMSADDTRNTISAILDALPGARG